MAMSQPRLPSSIDLSGLPPRVAEAVAQMTAVCHRQLGSERSPGAFEETERRVRESVHALGCEILGACAEGRDDGAPQWHSDNDFRHSDKQTPALRARAGSGGLSLGLVSMSGGGSLEPLAP